jgi:hypothetical protein
MRLTSANFYIGSENQHLMTFMSWFHPTAWMNKFTKFRTIKNPIVETDYLGLEVVCQFPGIRNVITFSIRGEIDKNFIDENVQQTVCDFSATLGGSMMKAFPTCKESVIVWSSNVTLTPSLTTVRAVSEHFECSSCYYDITVTVPTQNWEEGLPYDSIVTVRQYRSTTKQNPIQSIWEIMVPPSDAHSMLQSVFHTQSSTAITTFALK